VIKIITSEVVVAYSQCPYKAFLILRSGGQEIQHEYEQLIEKKAHQNRIQYLNFIKQKYPDVRTGDTATLTIGEDFLLDIQLNFRDLTAEANVLTKVDTNSSLGKYSYEPISFVGTHRIIKEQKLALLFTGYVLGKLQNKLPVSGKIIGANGVTHKVSMESAEITITRIINVLRQWTNSLPAAPPSVILNKHCQTCQFQKACLEQAEKADDLSLLNKVTPKIIQKYHKKGIFTVTQLSYVFKPKRSRKRRTKAPVLFNVELQALALRTGTTYIQELPTLHRCEVELFLDFEGVPDQNFQYLIGLLIKEQGNRSYFAFWGNSPEEEQQIWSEALAKISQYPEAPIYHYGSYESHAIDGLVKKYQTDCDALKNRLINLNSYIYGKVYFPSRSNSLKELGKLIGASWTAPNSSGLQSLVWRYYWEETHDSQYQKILIAYNREDCEALRLLAEELTNIITSADTHKNIDFADQPKQNATELGHQIHRGLQSIIEYAHADYDKSRISIRAQTNIEIEKKKRGGVKGHQGQLRIVRKADHVIELEPRITCPKHEDRLLEKSIKIADKFIINLRFTKAGIKKVVTKYIGIKRYCKKCKKYYPPPSVDEIGTRLFGHAFQAWVIYQRIVLRLPYRSITQEIEDIFNEQVSGSTLVNFIKYFSEHYAETEKMSEQRILESPFVHIDETLISIEGTNYYVWVITDRKHVTFRMTATRETTIVQEFLLNYKGVLITDFYGGYDAIPCRQQRCLVHLIRDLNDDLWSNPYNRVYESFVNEVNTLLIPIFEAEEKYGLKTRHLRMFKKSVDQFFHDNIDKAPSNCELVSKYQKRFQRYRSSLFTFLELDGIPWHNNTAENAIRHLAIQRKISGSFFKNVATQYLRLLGIAQTCKFQDKSLLKFLLSEEIDVDRFKVARRMQKHT
jgi:predicted RecB family nuclease